MTDSLSQYCPNCEAQANTIEELRAANERWVIAFNLTEADARDRIEALTAEVERLKLELESAKDMFDRHVEWASEQNAVVVCPRAIPPLNYCTDCDGSFPCHLQALEKQP
jgi:uncharacterized small protein (DUF1192 family)